jgi:hypothetical protein
MENIKFISPKITSQKPEQERRKEIRRDNTLNPYYNIVRSLSQLLSITRLYEFKHKIFKENLKEVFSEVSKLLSEKQSLSLFESEGTLLVNHKQIETKDGLMRRIVNSLRDLDTGYITLESGLTLEEFTVFIHLLRNEGSLKGEEKVKQYLKEKGAKHIIPRSATYKIIEEDEKVIKEGQAQAVEELSFEIRNRFLEDLRKGEVSKRLTNEEQKYRALAHNPIFLAEAVSDLVKGKDSPEELAKVLWLIGDYLIGEIDSAREEKINRRAIEGLKKQIFSLWEKRISKADMAKHIQKTFAAISLASELKGFILLYEKHKKNMDKTALKIQEIFEILPPESQLYQKMKEKLEKIGLFSKQK